MSHELRTPLNAVLGYAQMLQRGQELGSTQQQGVQTIYESGMHLLTLINDILDLSKIEAKKMELPPEALSLANFLDDVIDIIRMRAQEKRIDVHYQKNRDLPETIKADPVMDGFDATRAIRALFPELPIIAVSASVLNEDAPGFDAFLLKPVDLDRLLSMLQELCSLEWEYESAVEEEKGSSPPPSETIAPPQDIVQELYEIAQMGIMDRIGAQADKLERRDSRYAAFARQIQQFAESFEDEKLLHCLGQHLLAFSGKIRGSIFNV